MTHPGEDMTAEHMTTPHTNAEPMTAENVVAEIGLAAGKIWSFLSDNGACSVNRLIKELDVSRELVMQGIGWLAREDKLLFHKLGRGRTISLK